MLGGPGERGAGVPGCWGGWGEGCQRAGGARGRASELVAGGAGATVSLSNEGWWSARSELVSVPVMSLPLVTKGARRALSPRGTHRRATPQARTLPAGPRGARGRWGHRDGLGGRSSRWVWGTWPPCPMKEPSLPCSRASARHGHLRGPTCSQENACAASTGAPVNHMRSRVRARVPA